MSFHQVVANRREIETEGFDTGSPAFRRSSPEPYQNSGVTVLRCQCSRPFLCPTAHESKWQPNCKCRPSRSAVWASPSRTNRIHRALTGLADRGIADHESFQRKGKERT